MEMMATENKVLRLWSKKNDIAAWEYLSLLIKYLVSLCMHLSLGKTENF